ncbi:MAG: DUF1385 domain-containing protein, partial [Acidobacteria bacterium]|nr:DUF1385 domain-containing protein [Acidobacteriota bacterium]
MNTQTTTPEKEIIVGGQAVLEGVMMRTPNAYAVTVRRQDGTLVSQSAPLQKLSDKYWWAKIPVLRGGAVLIHSMMLGVKALNFSANVMMEEEEERGRAGVATTILNTLAHTLMIPVNALNFSVSSEGEPTTDASGSAQAKAVAAGSLVFALTFNILLFVVLPLLLTNALFNYFGWTNAPSVTPIADGAWYQTAWATLQAYMKPVRPSIEFNLVDGVIRMFFFLVMIYSFSKMRDIRRVFEYHGAEHKTVFAWEAGEALTPENAQRHRRQHPRCGTSFLMLVVLVSIILFSVVKFDSLLLNLLTRIALMPVIAGISYEIIRAAGKKEASAFFSFITKPGIWLQNLTTQEPDDSQLEVAIHALNESLKLEPVE